MILRLDDRTTELHRSYRTILNVLAEVSSVFKTLTFFVGFVLIPFAKFSLNLTLSNKIFSFI